MFKKIFSILVVIVLLFTNYSYASPIDIINEIRSKKPVTTSGNILIANALNRTNEKNNVKIIKTDEELQEEIELQEQRTEIYDVLNIKNKSNDKNAYIRGLDISKWNGNINWKKVRKAGIKFVIIRAGYGTNYVDPYFEKDIEAAIKHNMIIGIYWFSYAFTERQAVREADKCYSVIKKYKDKISLPVFWDFEYDSVNYANRQGVMPNKRLVSNMGDKFCNRMKKHGFHTGIYCNIDYANRYFTKEVLSKYHTWIAQWYSICTYKEHYVIWQNTDNYYIGNKRFDLNYLYYNKYESDIRNEKG